MMKIEYLREFIALAKYLNFSVAADSLFITQPALSRHISYIENELGVKLFERDTHSVRLTNEGRFFQTEIYEIIEKYDFILERMSGFQNGISGKLRMGILYYAVERYLSPTIKNFYEKYPHIILDIFPAYPIKIVEDLLCNKIDIGIFMHVNFTNSTHLQFFDFYRESLIAVLNGNHELAGRSSISLSELKDEEFITIKDDFFLGYKEYVNSMCRIHGFDAKEGVYVNNLEAMLLRIQTKGGVFILPLHNKIMSMSNITYVDIADEDCFFNMSIVYKSNNNNHAIPLFIKYFDSIFK